MQADGRLRSDRAVDVFAVEALAAFLREYYF